MCGPSVWIWRTVSGQNAVSSIERLHAVEKMRRLLPLGGTAPLQVANLFVLPVRQETFWRLKLAQPLQDPLILEISFDLSTQSNAPHAAVLLGFLPARTPFQLATISDLLHSTAVQTQ